jgi:PAS domain-containing protein
MEVAGTAVWELNALTGELHVDPRALSRLGYQASEIPMTLDALGALVHPDDRARPATALNELLTGKSDSYHAVYRFCRKDGHWSWVENLGRIIERTADCRHRPDDAEYDRPGFGGRPPPNPAWHPNHPLQRVRERGTLQQCQIRGYRFNSNQTAAGF